MYKFLTAEEFSHAIVAAPMDINFNFTFDQSEEYFQHGEPEGWYGAKIIQVFDEAIGCFCVGYYGGGNTQLYEIDREMSGYNIDHFIEEVLEDYATDECTANAKFCVEITEDNKKYLEVE